jgi:hypothetical protein
MAKPAITKRTTKGSALTYSELDTNFQNLADATVSLTAGTGGTAVTADLNGNITLVAGTNISLTGDNTAKTLTINSTGGGGVTNPMTANLDLNGYYLNDSTGGVTIQDSVVIKTSSAEPYLSFQVGSSGSITALTAAGTNDLIVGTLETGIGFKSQITISDNGTNINLQNSSATGYVSFNPGITRHNPLTTTQRNAITALSGMIIFNSTVSKFQGYDGTNWIDLH